MDVNTILLVAFIVLMIFCCGGMMKGMKGRKNKQEQPQPSNDADKSTSRTDDTSA